MKTMKKVTALLLALMMVLSLAACGGKTDNGGNSDNNGSGGKDQPAAVDMTAQEVLDALKEKLGDSYGCDLAEDESRMTGYYELDMSKIDSWAAESSENSALDPSTAVVLKVKDGYAQDAAALLQTGYQQVLDYCRARKGYGTDVDRADRQQRMLFAIFTQLREGSRLTSIPKLYLSVKDYIYTDLTAEQIAALAVFGMDLVPGESLVRHTLKGKYISGTAYNGASFYVLDTRALKSLMKDIFGVDIKVDYRYDYRYIQDKKS